jgi:hypothetical protein
VLPCFDPTWSALCHLSRLRNNTFQIWKSFINSWCNVIYFEPCCHLKLINISPSKLKTDGGMRVHFSGNRQVRGSGMWFVGYEGQRRRRRLSGLGECCQVAGCQEWGSAARLQVVRSEEVLPGCRLSGVRKCCQVAGCQEWGSAARSQAVWSEEVLLDFVAENPWGHNDLLFNFSEKYLET